MAVRDRMLLNTAMLRGGGGVRYRDGKCDTLAQIIPVKIFFIFLRHLTEIGKKWAENEENLTKLP